MAMNRQLRRWTLTSGRFLRGERPGPQRLGIMHADGSRCPLVTTYIEPGTRAHLPCQVDPVGGPPVFHPVRAGWPAARTSNDGLGLDVLELAAGHGRCGQGRL